MASTTSTLLPLYAVGSGELLQVVEIEHFILATVFLGFFGVVCAWGCQTASAAARILIKRAGGER